jgi:hypothetical protein
MGIQVGDAADIPNVQTLIVPHSFQANRQKVPRIESHCLTQALNSEIKFNIGVRVVVHSQQIDKSTRRPNCHKSWVCGRPVIGREWWRIIVLGHLPVVKVTTLCTASRLVNLNNSTLKIHVEEAVVSWVGRPFDQTGFWAIHIAQTALDVLQLFLITTCVQMLRPSDRKRVWSSLISD